MFSAVCFTCWVQLWQDRFDLGRLVYFVCPALEDKCVFQCLFHLVCPALKTHIDFLDSFDLSGLALPK